MRMLLRTLPVLVLLIAGLTLAPAAGAWSCADPAQVVSAADMAFTGRIVDAVDGHLVVDVEEIWEGAPVPPRVRLAVALADSTPWSGGRDRVPDGYRSPRTWLFVPDATQDPPGVNPCTAYLLSTPGLAELRPAVVRQPGTQPAPLTPGEKDEPTPRGELRARQALAGAAVVVLLGGGLVLLRTRRGNRPSKPDDA